MQITFLRPVGDDSPVHRLWAGTKLLVVAAAGVSLSYRPSWPAIGAVAALVALTLVVARIPPSARPRYGRWFWAIVLLGALLTLLSGGGPELKIGSNSIGFGDLFQYIRFTAYAFVLFGASLVVGWTTPAAELAPALASLGRPLRWLRLPVDEWAVAVGLCVRSLPLLIDELRTLVAARRLRARPRIRTFGQLLSETADLLTAALAVSMRRAQEMAEAISARGGTGTLAHRKARLYRRDWVALTVGTVVCTAVWVLPNY